MSDNHQGIQTKQSCIAINQEKYGDNDRVDGMFGRKWNKWQQNKWVEQLSKQIEGRADEIYEDGDAYRGLVR